MYVIFHVEFNGIVRNIDFRRDITNKISKKDGTIFCLILVQHRRRNNFAHPMTSSLGCAAGAGVTAKQLRVTIVTIVIN